MYKYESKKGNIYIKNTDDKYILLDEICSKPKLYKSKLLYIHPYDLEVKGSLYIYDFNTNKKVKLFSPCNQKTIKDCDWYNENKIYFLLGNMYGTVNIGGDLYQLDMDTNKNILVKKFKDSIEINKVNIVKDNIILSGIRYIDKEFLKFEKIEKVFNLKKKI